MGLLVAVLSLAGSAAPANRVTVITDSVGGVLVWDEAAHDALASRVDLQVDARVCRKLVEPGCAADGDPAPESALAAVERFGGDLGQTVVIDVGYNDRADAYAEGIDAVMRALTQAGVEHVIWVTLAERNEVWVRTNEEIRAAAARWPQLTIADWAARAAGQDWFVDVAHLNHSGAVALAALLRPLVLDACGAACVAPFSFCGLARTVNGFDPVRASALACPDALVDVAAIERGTRGDWNCSRAVHAAYELECRQGEAVIQVLERSPVRAVWRKPGLVRLANWLFHLEGRTLFAREDGSVWARIGRAPFCIPAVPREVLVTLRLAPTTPHGGCFTV